MFFTIFTLTNKLTKLHFPPVLQAKGHFNGSLLEGSTNLFLSTNLIRGIGWQLGDQVTIEMAEVKEDPMINKKTHLTIFSMQEIKVSSKTNFQVRNLTFSIFTYYIF